MITLDYFLRAMWNLLLRRGAANVEPEQTIPEIWREKLLLWMAMTMIPIYSIVFVVANVMLLLLHISLQKFKTYILPIFKEKMYKWGSGVGSMIIFHLSKLWKAKFFILCDVIFLLRLQGKIIYSWSLR